MSARVKNVFLFITTLTSFILACIGFEIRSEHHLGWLIFFTGVAGCISGSLTLAESTYRVVVESQATDRALWLVVPGLLIICLASPLEFLYLPAFLPRTAAVEEAGLVLFILALATFLISRGLERYHPGRYIRVNLLDRLEHAGFLRLVHFMVYIALGLAALGVCVGFSSSIGLLAFTLLLLPGVVYRLRLESGLTEA
jgi:hypothetical protein